MNKIACGHFVILYIIVNRLFLSVELCEDASMTGVMGEGAAAAADQMVIFALTAKRLEI